MTSPASPTDPISQGDSEVDEKLEHSQSDHSGIPLAISKDFGFIPIPRHLQYDPTKPFHFGLLLNIAFGFASTFSEYSLPFYSAFDCSSITNFDYSCCESLLLSTLAQ